MFLPYSHLGLLSVELIFDLRLNERYIEFVADRLLVSLGNPKEWNSENPFDFMTVRNPLLNSSVSIIIFNVSFVVTAHRCKVLMERPTSSKNVSQSLRPLLSVLPKAYSN